MDKGYIIEYILHTVGYIMVYYSTIRKKETLLFMTILMNLEGIMLNKISQTMEVYTQGTTLDMWNLKKKKKNKKLWKQIIEKQKLREIGREW